MNETSRPTDTDASDLVVDELLHRVSHARLAEAQLERVTASLHGPGAADQRELRELRETLLHGITRTELRRDGVLTEKDRHVISVSDMLRPWETLRLAYMVEGINEGPSERGTSGKIVSFELGAGGLSFGGTLDIQCRATVDSR